MQQNVERVDQAGLDIDLIKAQITCAPNYEHLSHALSRWRPRHNEQGEIVGGFGRLRNLKIWVNKTGITVEGSPHRFTHGANVYPFGPDSMALFIVVMAGILGVPLVCVERARVTWLAVALNVITEHSAATYFDVLQEAPYMKRSHTFATTLLYFNKTRKLRAYDKMVDLADGGLIPLVPDHLRDVNLTRIECETRKAQKDFPLLTLGDLADRHQWARIRDFWRKHYGNVKKAEGARPIVASKVKDLTAIYAGYGIEAMGGLSTAVKRVKADEEAGLIDRNQSLALRKRLAEIAGLSEGPKAELAAELARAVEEALHADVHRNDPRPKAKTERSGPAVAQARGPIPRGTKGQHGGGYPVA